MTTFILTYPIHTMAFGVFLLGCITFLSGIVTLLTKTMNKDVRKITNETTIMAQKGITEDIADLVGNASALLSATGDLVRTAAGIGVFLTVMGLILVAASFGLLQLIQ